MDWTSRRAEFPVTRRWAFFDHAAVAPLTGRACRAMKEWADDLAENGLVHESRWLKRIDEVRGLAGRLLNADPLDVAFVKNTSEGIGIVAEGFPWRPGDNVVTAEEEYPANLYPWLNLAGRGVELRRVAPRGSRIEIDDLRAAMDGRTRLVSLSSVEFASGFRNDLDAGRRDCAASAASSSSSMPSRGWAFCRSTSARRRSTSSPPTGTSGCSGRRGPASSTSAANWSTACTRSASAGTASSAAGTSHASTSRSSRTPAAGRAAA